MPLEQAGVDLQAKGFKDYLNKLDQIEKQQRAVFDQQFKGTDKSYDKVTRAAKDYERQLKSLEGEYNKAVAQEQRLADAQRKRADAQQARAAQQAALTRTIALGAAALVAREALQLGAESVNLARVQAKAEAQLAAGIKSTGGAAGVTSRELKELASGLQNTTNFGDEATIQMEALLLTFTNIREDELKQTVPLVQDLATRMGTDLNSAALQLAKALNDPAANLGALGRAGVQFSESQQAMIDRMLEANNIAGAQAIILAELRKEVGGSAAAAREADGGFDALGNALSDLKEQIGAFILDINKATGATEKSIGVVNTLTGTLAEIRFDLGLAEGAEAELAATKNELNDLINLRADVVKRAESQGSLSKAIFGPTTESKRYIELLGEYDTEIAKTEAKIKELKDAIDEQEKSQQKQNDTTQEAIGLTEAQKNQIQALGNAVRQAEGLQLSFARATEDANRKQARQQANLARTQTRDREKLLISQQKELDKFEKDRLEKLADFEKDRQKSIASAEKNIAKERERARQDEVDAQRRFQQRLQQEAERFRLSQRQSERRFQLDEKRLRAEGDILGLQQLRENHELEQLEARENFDLQQRQSKESEREQSRDRIKEQQERLEDLKANLDEQRAELELDLEEQRAELLAKFDEQLIDQREAQAEQRADLLRAAAEQEEDRRISQQRQLEDLGRSLADQKDLTAEGTRLIADEIEKIFGVEGVADTIFEGFTTRTESEFQDLFDDIETIVTEGARSIAAKLTPIGSSIDSRRGLGQNTFPQQFPGFQHGGSFTVGGSGGPDSQLVAFRGTPGERVTVTPHAMPAPVIPSQNLNVSMSGGFNITGAEQAGQVVVTAALDEMTESLAIALERLVRRHG